MEHSVIVRGLVAEDLGAFRKHFESCCPDASAMNCTLVFRNRRGKQVAFLRKGRIDFPDEACVKRALALDGSVLNGKKLRVSPFEAKPANTKDAAGSQRVAGGRRARKRQRREEERQQRSIFLGGLADGVTEEEVRTALKRYGQVADIRLTPASVDGKGFCIVEMQQLKGVRRLLETKGLTLHDKEVRIEPCRKKSAELDDEGCGLQNASQCFLRNIPMSASETAVRKALQKFGFVASVQFVEKDGKRTGQAVIEFERPAAAVLAVEAGKAFVQGRPVLIDFSKGKLTRRTQRESAHEFAGVKRVLVAGLAESVTPQDIRSLFGRCGGIEEVLPLDTPDPTGAKQAVVEFRLTASVAPAVEMTGRQWKGSALFVQPLKEDDTADRRTKKRKQEQEPEEPQSAKKQDKWKNTTP